MHSLPNVDMFPNNVDLYILQEVQSALNLRYFDKTYFTNKIVDTINYTINAKMQLTIP